MRFNIDPNAYPEVKELIEIIQNGIKKEILTILCAIGEYYEANKES